MRRRGGGAVLPLAPTDQPHIRDGMVGARHGRAVTTEVRPPVRLATRGMCVVSRASARVIACRMMVSNRASMDVPAPEGARRGTLCSHALGVSPPLEP
jgi:hypothetical protein